VGKIPQKYLFLFDLVLESLRLNIEGFNVGAALFAYLFMLFSALFIIKRWARGVVFALAALLGMLLALLL